MLPLDLNRNPGCEYDSLAWLPEAIGHYAVHYDYVEGAMLSSDASCTKLLGMHNRVHLVIVFSSYRVGTKQAVPYSAGLA